MGNFYANITVIGGLTADILAEYKNLRREGYILPLGPMCVVYDRECDMQNEEILAALAEHLSTHLQAKCFAVLNHDDDILWFQLYEGSRLVSEYANRGGPGTDVGTLCRAFGKTDVFFQAWLLLHRPFLFQVQRHYRLASIFGLPKASVGSGFNYIKNGEMPDGAKKEDIIYIN